MMMMTNNDHQDPSVANGDAQPQNERKKKVQSTTYAGGERERGPGSSTGKSALTSLGAVVVAGMVGIMMGSEMMNCYQQQALFSACEF